MDIPQELVQEATREALIRYIKELIANNRAGMFKYDLVNRIQREIEILQVQPSMAQEIRNICSEYLIENKDEIFRRVVEDVKNKRRDREEDY